MVRLAVIVGEVLYIHLSSTGRISGNSQESIQTQSSPATALISPQMKGSFVATILDSTGEAKNVTEQRG